MSKGTAAPKFNNELDVHIKAKGVNIGGSKSQSFNGLPVELTKLLQGGFSGPLRVQVRVAPEEMADLVSGINELATTDLAQRNGLKLDIHLGARQSQYGAAFDASFFYVKPVQDRNTGVKAGAANPIINKVGGNASIPSPGSFSSESSKG